jgi:prepilin-type N-terminal cleavage/methylation domain-containing protein
MRTLPTRRTAFTLVELLIVITVIGILVGLLLGAVVPAFKRANEFAIQTEMTQLERAVESFKTKYGFYPPSFVRIQNPGDVTGDGSINDDDCIAALLPYINRIAPNHNETAINPSTNNTYIFDWWDMVGRNIGYGTGQDLVFWLAGLSKNKQRPLTGDGEKDVFYDFKQNQLDFSNGTAAYLQPKGKSVPFLYVDNSSYGYGPSLPASQGGPIFFDGFTNTPGGFSGSNFVPGVYENPNSFQLVTFGMDGLVGAPWEPDAANTSNFTTDWHRFVSGAAADNQCNFAGGRLERMLLGTTN